MQNYKEKCGYGGFGILPFGKDFEPVYLTGDYFDLYETAIIKADELGMKLFIYDEYGFPSGSGGAIHGDGIGRFMALHPDQTIKRLDKLEKDIIGFGEFTEQIPGGALMGIVAMNMMSGERIDITSYAVNGLVKWQVPEGRWKIMIFSCVKDGDPNVDYLDASAVKNFIGMIHQAYYDRFKSYFGKVITGSFFDEPTMYRANGRIWTDSFNIKFQQKYSFNPVIYYPALWYDIGEETKAARNYLFGFRTELYSAGFTKEIQDWCTGHGITATGHQDQEEVLNPVSVSGDLMKCFKYLDIPGIDKIGGNRPAERFYKIISSSAYNWDKYLVMSETYGAMGNLTWEKMYLVAMEQYMKGINFLVPHAVWYDDKNVTFKPELSYRNPLYADSLPAFNNYLGRLNILLQNKSQHVADIAILYPINSIQAEHYFDGPLGFYKGGVALQDSDYIDIGEILIREIGMDFTYIHPEVLDEKCVVNNGSLKLINKINPESFTVLIIPACEVISLSNLEKIKSFYDNGGTVIFTTRLPLFSSEFGGDIKINQIIHSLMPGFEISNPRFSYKNNNGGNMIFLHNPNSHNLKESLIMTEKIFDVSFEENKTLRYIHKIYGGRDIYFLGNLENVTVNSKIQLRGSKKLEVWNPYTASISKADTQYGKNSGVEVTFVTIILNPNKSVFLVTRN